jgi:hypothetical protein
MNDQVYAVIVIPFASAAILAILPGYRLRSALNVFASFLTLLAGLNDTGPRMSLCTRGRNPQHSVVSGGRPRLT